MNNRYKRYYSNNHNKRVSNNKKGYCNNTYYIGNKRYRDFKTIKRVILLTALMLTTSFLIAKQFSKAIIVSIENQDTMLCESALISENKKYLNICKCYYKTKNIKCLQSIERGDQ